MTAPDAGTPAVDEALVEALVAHYATYTDMGTPRQYTERGGWNICCTCDTWIGESGDEDIPERHSAHVAAALAPVLAEQRAAALRDFADAMEVQTEHPASGQCKGCDGLRYAARIARERADRIAGAE